MYTAFYGLREKPFSLSPDPRFLYLADSHREALAHLLYGIDQGEGFMAITGEVGTGKTTICRTLLERLGAGTEVAFLFNPSRSAEELLRSIAIEFGLSGEGQSRHELNDQLNRFLLGKRSEGGRVLLIVDEAQNLGTDTLEEIRLLSNLETSTSKLIQILLLGQPELDRKLDSEELRQLRQRISVRWNLAALSRRETADYVCHRLKVAAGAEREIFDAGALEEIHRRSRGIPRLVNILCDRSLLAGYADGAHRIGAKLVRRAAQEIPDTRLRRISRSPRAASRRRSGLAAGVAAAVVLAGLLASERAGLLGEAVVWTHETVGESRFMGVLTGSGSGADERSEPSGPAELRAAEVPEAGSSEGNGTEPLRAPVSSPPPMQAALRGESLFDPAGSVLGSDDSAVRDERQLNTQPGSFLGRLLDGQGAASARLHAVNAILDSYGLERVDLAPESDEEALAILADHGLGLLALDTADLGELRSLDRPTLLLLRSELDDWRLVALRGLGDELGLIVGATGEEVLPVAVGELELQWEGEAWVVWDAVEGVPEMLAVGSEGGAVVWLQRSLADLGYYHGEASGFFDGSTRAGVMALQLDSSLTPDGVVGPRTQMAVNALLERNDVPRLSTVDEDGLRAFSAASGDTPVAPPAAGADVQSDYEDRESDLRLPAEDGSG
jgi:general secretion pathway protein A